MQKTVYNPQKGRLESINVNFTAANTTWFDDADAGISLIADYDGGLLIADNGYSYPILIYDVSRSDIGHDRGKAKELKMNYTI